MTATAAASPPAVSPPAASALARRWLARGELVDVAGATTLALVAGVGFHTSFGGWRFMTPVVAGAVLGPLVAVVGTRTRWPGSVVAAFAVAVFFLSGGPFTVLAETTSGLPNLVSLVSMIRGGTDGWARLLTVIPPAGQEGNLLVVPFETTYLAGLLGGSLARRRKWVGPPIVPGLAALVLAVLWGTDVPAALLVQGCGFAVVASAWMALRAGRGTKTLGATSGRLRRLSAVLMIVAAVGVAAAVSGSLPLTNPTRFVLRDHTEPPLDPSAFASPLARWPYYSDESRKATTLFRVETDHPLPKDSFFRLAAMDAYDGSVFTVDTRGRGSSGVFVKASSDLPGAGLGPRVDLKLTIDQLADVWVPVLGQPASVLATGNPSRAIAMQEALRFNRSTRALILPSVTRPGDRLDLSAVLDPPTDPARAETAAADLAKTGPPLPAETPPSFRELARRIVADNPKATTPYLQAKALAETLKADGGNKPDERGTHSLFRLETFLGDYIRGKLAGANDAAGSGSAYNGPVGTPEQYAATMAIMARAIDLPARAVVGFQAPEGVTAFDVHGENVKAWVEGALEGIGWARFDPVPDKITPVHHDSPPPSNSENLPPEPPPPAVPPPPTIVPDAGCAAKGAAAKGTAAKPSCPPDRVIHSTFHLGTAGKIGLWLLSIPAGAAASTGLIGWAKRRRRRRRSRGSPVEQVRGAWAEYLDQAKDIGRPVPPFVTRLEAGILIGGAAGARVAAATDAMAFGAGVLEEQDIERHWKAVDEALAELALGKSRWERWQARLNLQSFLERPKDPSRSARRLKGRRGRAAAAEVQP